METDQFSSPCDNEKAYDKCVTHLKCLCQPACEFLLTCLSSKFLPLVLFLVITTSF